jgi:hypothetical protein
MVGLGSDLPAHREERLTLDYRVAIIFRTIFTAGFIAAFVSEPFILDLVSRH